METVALIMNAFLSKLRIQLVEDWRNGMRWISTQCFIAVGIIQSLWKVTPDDMKASVPSDLVFYLTIAILALGFVGRFIDQKLPPKGGGRTSETRSVEGEKEP